MKTTTKIAIAAFGSVFFFSVLTVQAQFLTPEKQQQLTDIQKLLNQTKGQNPNLAPYAEQSLDLIKSIQEMNKVLPSVPPAVKAPVIKKPIQKAPTPPPKPKSLQELEVARLEAIIQETPAFKDVFKGASPELGISLVDKDVQEKFGTVVIEGRTQQDIAVQKTTAIREVGKKKYNYTIESSLQDANRDGISDEVEVLLGGDPTIQDTGTFSAAEQKLYGIHNRAEYKKISNQCVVNLASGEKVLEKGFAILAACPAGRDFALSAIDKEGKKTLLAAKTSSDNTKIVFTVEKKLKSGTYVLQVEPNATMQGSAVQSSVLQNEIKSSVPILVEVVNDAAVNQPRVQRIENFEVDGDSDITVHPTADGRVRVTGTADAASMVVATFSSAVYTSALLADSKGGSFEAVSAQPLEKGDHEVVVYATTTEGNLRSTPRSLKFRIVDTAVAASGRVSGEEGGKSAGMPWTIPVGVAALALFVGIGAYFAFRKK